MHRHASNVRSHRVALYRGNFLSYMYWTRLDNFGIYVADRKATKPVYRQSFFCSAVLTPQHYHWYAVTPFAFPGAEWTTAVDELNRPVSSSSVISACWRLMRYDVKISGAPNRTHDLWTREWVCYPLHHSAPQTRSQASQHTSWNNDS